MIITKCVFLNYEVSKVQSCALCAMNKAYKNDHNQISVHIIQGDIVQNYKYSQTYKQARFFIRIQKTYSSDNIQIII